ncbi:hypothetical protein [Sphingobacterium faecium]
MKKFLCIVFLCAFVSCAYSQNRKLFFLNENNSVQNNFVQRNHLSTYVIVSQGHFVINEKFSKTDLEKIILKSFPKKYDTGYAVLDWEGSGMQSLIRQNSRFEYYISEYIKAIEYAKSFRPNVKWSFYGVPYQYYERSVDVYASKIQKLSELIKKIDFLAPSLYIMSNETMSAAEKEKIKQTLSISIKFGLKYSKPVYPFIWHRIHPSNQKNGISLVNQEIFENHIKYLLDLRYKNIGISGLMWWHSEKYSYDRKLQNVQVKRAYSAISDFEKFQDDTFDRYYKIIKKYL